MNYNFYLLLDTDAVSICNYVTCCSEAGQHFISLNTLKQFIDYANKYEYVVSFVHGRILPDEYYSVLSSCINQTNIMGPELFDTLYDLPNITISLESDRVKLLSSRKMSQDLNRSAILRFNKNNVSELYNAVISLLRISQRVTIVSDDNSYYEKDCREQYENEIKKISEVLKSELRLGKLTEINVLTDSILTNNPNQCSAGTTSFSLTADGKLYPCPAFAGMSEWELPFSYDSSFENKFESSFALRPICAGCENTHCRRCAYINFTSTKEICIPPYEMCEVARIERQVSKSICGE